MTEYKYLARLYNQHSDANTSIVSFIATANEIANWAGVPRKATMLEKGTLVGFQRGLDEGRVAEIQSFFDNPSNLSPTAIVVAFRKDKLKVEPFESELLKKIDNSNKYGKLVEITIHSDDFSGLTLTELIKSFIKIMDKRLSNENLDNYNQVDDNTLDAYTYQSIDDEMFEIHDSHLRLFLKDLSAMERDLQKGKPLPVNVDEKDLRDTIESMLRPAMLVDGQHRVFGAQRYDEDLSFTVCGLVDASWEEQVFQFVVINQKSSKIPAPFLNAIVSSSLTQKEVDLLGMRLKNAGIYVKDAQLMDQVNNNQQSPFYQMIQFNIPGEQGRIPWQGVKALVSKFYNVKAADPTFAFNQLVAPICQGKNIEEKRSDWQNKKWFDYFCAFWSAIKEKYEPAPEGSLPLWNIKENPESQLLRIVTLHMLQDMFIEWFLNTRDHFPESIKEFKESVNKWIKNVPPEFFRVKWQGVTSLPRDGKVKLEESLAQTLKFPNYHWRKTRLFLPR